MGIVFVFCLEFLVNVVYCEVLKGLCVVCIVLIVIMFGCSVCGLFNWMFFDVVVFGVLFLLDYLFVYDVIKVL